MALECDNQGMIPVMDIVDAVNKNESDITILGGSGIGDRVTANEEAIEGLNSRVVTLENSSVTNENMAIIDERVTVNEANIDTNRTAIAQNTTDITTNFNSISSMFPMITQNTEDIVLLDAGVEALNSGLAAQGGRVAQNESDIDALQSTIGAGSEAIYVHEEASSVNGGTSVTGTWTPRNVGTEKSNSIGAVGGATSITFPEGVYDFEVHAVVKDSASQTRINIGGSSFIYGLSLHEGGVSQAIGRATLNVATVVSIETNVDAGVADSGFGLSNTFSTPNTYVTFHAEKVG